MEQKKRENLKEHTVFDFDDWITTKSKFRLRRDPVVEVLALRQGGPKDVPRSSDDVKVGWQAQ